VITMLIADDHPLVLRGLSDLLSQQGNITIVASCTDGISALEAARLYRPDVAVGDVNMPGMDGLAFLGAVTESGLPSRVVLLTAGLSDAQIYDAVSGGVAGLMLKDSASDMLLDCIARVCNGEQWLPPDLVDAAIAREGDRREKAREVWGSLTEREREIALLTTENLSNKDIARQLDIAEGTVKLHLNHIYAKLQIMHRASLVALVLSVIDQRPSPKTDSAGS